MASIPLFEMLQLLMLQRMMLRNRSVVRSRCSLDVI
jgi:hypothetical protein